MTGQKITEDELRPERHRKDPTVIDAYKIPINQLTLAETQPDQVPATIRGYRSPSKPFRGNRDVTKKSRPGGNSDPTADGGPESQARALGTSPGP